MYNSGNIAFLVDEFMEVAGRLDKVLIAFDVNRFKEGGFERRA